MLVVITTDYPLEEGEADAFLRPAVEASFNRISVDGDCSTNDAVVLLANGASGAPRDDARLRGRAGRRLLDPRPADRGRRRGCDGRARDRRHGRRDEAEAEAIARRIATSPLVKTAAFGHDPNWGRVLMAAGSAPYGDGYAGSTRTGSRLVRRHRGLRRRRADRARAGALGGRLPIDLDLGLGTAGRYLAPTSPTTTSGSTRSTRREPGRAQARRPGRRARRRRRRSRSAGRPRGRRRARGGPADLDRDGAAWDRACFRGRPARDVGGRARGRSRLVRRGQRRGLRGDRPDRRCRSSATRSGLRRRRSRRSGSLAIRLPFAPGAVEEALADGPDPGRRAARVRAGGRR